MSGNQELVRKAKKLRASIAKASIILLNTVPEPRRYEGQYPRLRDRFADMLFKCDEAIAAAEDASTENIPSGRSKITA